MQVLTPARAASSCATAVRSALTAVASTESRSRRSGGRPSRPATCISPPGAHARTAATKSASTSATCVERSPRVISTVVTAPSPSLSSATTQVVRGVAVTAARRRSCSRMPLTLPRGRHDGGRRRFRGRRSTTSAGCASAIRTSRRPPRNRYLPDRVRIIGADHDNMSINVHSRRATRRTSRHAHHGNEGTSFHAGIRQRPPLWTAERPAAR